MPKVRKILRDFYKARNFKHIIKEDREEFICEKSKMKFTHFFDKRKPKVEYLD